QAVDHPPAAAIQGLPGAEVALRDGDHVRDGCANRCARGLTIQPGLRDGHRRLDAAEMIRAVVRGGRAVRPYLQAVEAEALRVELLLLHEFRVVAVAREGFGGVARAVETEAARPPPRDDDLETERPRPIHEPHDAARLVAVRDRVDDARRPRPAVEDRPDRDI